MEAIVRLICRETANHVQNRVLAANDDRFARVEELDGAVEVVRLPAKNESGVTFRIPITTGSRRLRIFPLQLSVVLVENNVSFAFKTGILVQLF